MFVSVCEEGSWVYSFVVREQESGTILVFDARARFLFQHFELLI
jgi:hypothetical protein